MDAQMAGGQPARLRGQARGRGRAARGPRDMALSMGVLVVPVLVLVVLYNVLFNGGSPRAIDPSDTFTAARHSAAFTIVEPEGLPGGWTAVSSSYQRQGDGSVLRVGYVAPGGGLQLIESDRPVNVLLPDELGSDAQPGNLVSIGGQRWREYPVARGGRALVLATGSGTVCIVGAAPAGDLHTLAGHLH